MNDLLKWLKLNFIKFEEVDKRFVKINGKVYFLLNNTYTEVFDKETFKLLVNNDDLEFIEDLHVDYFVLSFGPDFYYQDVNYDGEFQFKELRFVGECVDFISDGEKEQYSHYLGVHGRYELMNGTGDYDDWCEKAKFIGYKSLGIAERNTLAGTLPFQLSCAKNNIQPIIGETVIVKMENHPRFEIKLFCKNEEGWRNLLAVNKNINIDNQNRHTDWEVLKKHSSGLVCVLAKSESISNKTFLNVLKSTFENFYVQIDSNVYSDIAKRKHKFNNIKSFINDKICNDYNLLLISDSYCLHKNQVGVKDMLNVVGSIKNDYKTENHYFRNKDEFYLEFLEMFNDVSRGDLLFSKTSDHLNDIANMCQFKIDVKNLHLPHYEMNEDEASKNETNEDLFYSMVKAGLEKLNYDKFPQEVVFERLQKEIEVITKGGFIDYFLILADIIKWCESVGILVGTGRGSAAGSIISYLLGIVKLNPLEYNLLFERFLNESRIKSEMPDIDVDFDSERRHEVLQYMRDKYGENYVCQIGSYGSLQVKGALKEVAKYYSSAPSSTMSFLTKFIEGTESSWSAIFKAALKNRDLKNFVTINGKTVFDTRSILNCLKSTSIHPCATIIVPKVDAKGNKRDIFEWIPVRQTEDGHLVSEWEGGHIAKAGFLKEDILATKQVTKISNIFNKIKEAHNIDLNFENIPFDDKATLDLFVEGKTQDVFQFGSSGLTSYCKQVRPDSLKDLINMTALYRPGAMSSNAHMEYIDLKDGNKEPEYDFKLKEVTEDTFGLYIYQEQVMAACQVLAGFDLNEADKIRKAMGKKDTDLINEYGDLFVENSVKNGCERREAIYIWDKMREFSKYGFNKSHSAAYSIISYVCNYLKANYPLEFWTTALKYNTDDSKLSLYISEIDQQGKVQVMPPNINKTQSDFFEEREGQKIYWAINRIKFVGDSAVSAIIEERDKNGHFFGLEDFLERVEKRKVNKRCLKNLILAGCFDEHYNITDNLKDRIKIFEEYCKIREEEMFEDLTDKESIESNSFWAVQQKMVGSYSPINANKIIHNKAVDESFRRDFTLLKSPFEVRNDDLDNKEVIVIGLISDLIIKKIKNGTNKGKEFANVVLDVNNEMIKVMLWPEQFVPNKELLQSSTNKILIIRGLVNPPNDYDADHKINCQNDEKRKGKKLLQILY